VIRKRCITAAAVCFLLAGSAHAQTNITEFTAYWKHKVSLFRSLPNPTGEICFLGDSITDGCEWHELVGDANVTNRGISGDTAWGVLARLDEILESQPLKIFLMIGTNDLARGKSPEDVRDKISEIIDEIESKSPDTILYVESVLPTDENRAPAYGNRNINILNEILLDLAISKGALWIDLASSFKDETGQLRADLSEDGLHLNGKAYQLWLSLISDHLKQATG